MQKFPVSGAANLILEKDDVTQTLQMRGKTFRAV